MRFGRRIIRLPPHYNPFLVRAGHHDFPFLLGLGPVQHERRCLLGHLLVHVLQTIYRLFQPQHPTYGRAGLPKRLLNAQRLVPVLKHVGEDAFRQLQAIVQRHELDLLFFPTAVHGTL